MIDSKKFDVWINYWIQNFQVCNFIFLIFFPFLDVYLKILLTCSVFCHWQWLSEVSKPEFKSSLATLGCITLNTITFLTLLFLTYLWCSSKKHNQIVITVISKQLGKSKILRKLNIPEQGIFQFMEGIMFQKILLCSWVCFPFTCTWLFWHMEGCIIRNYKADTISSNGHSDLMSAWPRS